MAKLQVIVESIRLFNDGNRNTITINTKEQFDGYHKTDDGYELAKVNKFSIERVVFTAQVCQLDGDGQLIADYRACRDTGFDQKALALIFRGATLSIDRVEHKQGDEVLDMDGNPVQDKDGNNLVYERDCYTTEITGVRLTSTARDRVEAALTL